MQNGFAIGGDYMSAASFLGIAGLIALYGYDGFLYSIGFLVAWLVALLLVAELMRNTGKLHHGRRAQLPDAAAPGAHCGVASPPSWCRSSTCWPRWSAPVSWSRCCWASARRPAKNLVIAGVGMLMIVYVVFGGMKGTTWVQIVKAVMLMTGAAIMTIWVLAKFGFNLSALLGAAADASGKGESFLQPGSAVRRGERRLRKGLISKLDFISLALALVLGTAGLPHILIRFYTVPDCQGGPEVGAVGHRPDRRSST